MSEPSGDERVYVDGHFGPRTRAVIERFREEEAERIAELLAAACLLTARPERRPWWRLRFARPGRRSLSADPRRSRAV